MGCTRAWLHGLLKKPGPMCFEGAELYRLRKNSRGRNEPVERTFRFASTAVSQLVGPSGALKGHGFSRAVRGIHAVGLDRRLLEADAESEVRLPRCGTLTETQLECGIRNTLAFADCARVGLRRVDDHLGAGFSRLFGVLH